MTTNAELASKVGAMEKDMGTMAANLQTIADVMATLHKSMPITPNHSVEAGEVRSIGVAEFEEQDGEIILDHGIDLGDPEKAGWLEASLFLEEEVTVRIATTSDRQADSAFDVGVNGKMRTFVRGHTYKVPRKFVGVLAQARPVVYENQEYTMNDGSRGVRYPARSGVRYPFDVINDSPKGQEWLDHLLRQPN